MPAGLVATLALSQVNSRFELTAPLALPPVRVHHQLAKQGVAQSTAHRLGLQARILWVDATANLGRYNTPEKIAALCADAKEIGFNTIVFDVKPISGYTVYPSKLGEQLTEWRDAKLEPGFDPLNHMVTEAKKQGLVLLVSLNAFSEGHSYSKRDFGKPDNQFFKPGWGYENPEYQTVRYVAKPTLTTGNNTLDLNPTLTPTTWSEPLAIFNKIPTAEGVETYVSLDASGKVLQVNRQAPDQMVGSFTLAGRGPGAEALLKLSPGQTIIFGSSARFVPIGEDQNQIPLMMNPHLVANQQRSQAFVDELISNYDIDGVLYDDRLRFGGLDSDFSEFTRNQFEGEVKTTLNWPDDVYRVTYNLTPNGFITGIKPGPYFDRWLAFRARTMSLFMESIRRLVKFRKPEALFGIYAGSWYGDYPKYGSNYASPQLHAGFPFLTYAYRQTGFADKLDLLVTGAYYPDATVYDAVQKGRLPGRTVEAAGIISNAVARDQSWTVAGIMLADFFNDPTRVEPALQAAAATTQGVMVFDLSHQFDRFRPHLKQAFKNPAKAPYQTSNLLQMVRNQRQDFDNRGLPSPAFPMFEGAPGTGF